MTPVMKPIGLYVRVSRKGDREDDRFHSPREQEERARGLCHARGHAPGPVFADIDVSGATPPGDRPGMGALLGALEAGELGGLAAYSLDRLSREPAHGDALVKRVTAAGGIILTPDIPDAIDTPTGEFTFGMLLQVAKLYRSQAGARFASAREHAIAQGIPVTNRDAVGYTRGPDRRYHPNADAPVIRELFERRAQGQGPSELAEFLEANGVKTSQGARHWSRQAVYGLIRSRTYLGEIRSGEFVNTAAHEPIVDEPLWLAAQNPAPRPVRHRGGTHLLAGILRCAGCGYSMQGTRHSRGKRIYRCQRRHAGGLCPAPARIHADDIEEEVVARFLATADLVYERRAQDPDNRAHLEAELDAAERRLAQVMTDEARDALGDLWVADVKARREARDRAALALGEARVDPEDAARIDLVRHWRDEAGLATLGNHDAKDPARAVFLDTALKRSLLADAFPAIAVHRDGTLDWSPNLEGLSRRGFRRVPRLNPL